MLWAGNWFQKWVVPAILLSDHEMRFISMGKHKQVLCLAMREEGEEKVKEAHSRTRGFERKNIPFCIDKVDKRPSRCPVEIK